MNKHWKGFWIFCGVFALVFCLACGGGYLYLHSYLTDLEADVNAREAARPEVARDAYMAQLNEAYVLQRLEGLFAQVDSTLQSGDEARAAVSPWLGQGFGCKLSFSNARKQTYLLYAKTPIEGKFPQIGSFTIEPQGETVRGCTQWVLTQEEFNMDWLLQSVTVTVPHSCSLWLKGQSLSRDYITGREGYDALAPLPQTLPLPEKALYTLGPVVGGIAPEIRDEAGKLLVLDASTDWDSFLNNCTEQQEEQLRDFTKTFLKYYVRFTSSSRDISEHLGALQQYLLLGSDLHRRMKTAADGLQWTKARPDTLLDVQFKHMTALEDGRFLCDVVYTVQIQERNGRTAEVPVQLLVTPVGNSLKAEMMVFY